MDVVLQIRMINVQKTKFWTSYLATIGNSEHNVYQIIALESDTVWMLFDNVFIVLTFVD